VRNEDGGRGRGVAASSHVSSPRHVSADLAPTDGWQTGRDGPCSASGASRPSTVQV